MVNKLAPMDFQARSKRLRSSLEEAKLDTVLVTDLQNIRWLTGFKGSAAHLVFTQSGARLVTDARYDGQAQEEIQTAGSQVEVVIENSKQKKAILEACSGKKIGLEAESISWADFQMYEADWFEADLVSTTGLISTLRRKKDEGEVDRIRKAASIADQAFKKVEPLLEECPTEKQVARELESAMFEFGAEGISFETIVATGGHSAWAHARPTDENKIEKNQIVLIDMGALVDGYHSDMSRTLAVGDPGEIPNEIYAVVREAQVAGVEKVKAGSSCSEIDLACRTIIEEAGYGENFTHSTGHGVGLDIHEMPRVSKVSDDTLQVGEVITVEPGIYLQPYGGVRIEDTCLVTESGYEILTSTPKKSTLFN